MTKKRLTRQEMERHKQLQVMEYLERYYPEMGEVEVEISRCGNLARVFPAKPSDQRKDP